MFEKIKNFFFRFFTLRFKEYVVKRKFRNFRNDQIYRLLSVSCRIGLLPLGFKLNLVCKCKGDISTGSSPFINKSCEINRRIVFVMRLLGVGLQGINVFCSLMNICHGLANTTYYAILENLHCSAKSVFELMSRTFCLLRTTAQLVLRTPN
ncbi:hypothetical protein WH47_10923 [Habropoda laboriosa]|uniref:Uncharacterized protein n=1 Tax=Habropoda laboriosa TaxID=597456 RepID=A0A0L7QKF7_9HYME|nr:hypothetical protein WH47_10923 [Habropoda laboriosa]